MAKKKKGNKRNANLTKKRTVKTTNSGQVVSKELLMSKETHTQRDDASPQTYMGLKIKTWTIIILLSLVLSFVIFLIIPYFIGLGIAVKNENVDEFINKANGFTVVLSIIGSVASVASIVMTLVDKKRFSEEKKHSDQLFSEVKNLGVTLLNVSENIKTLKEENEKLSLEVHDLQDKVSISKEIIEANFKSWSEKQDAREKD